MERNKTRATKAREEIDEGMGRAIGSRGRMRESEGYHQSLDGKCVSINILYLGLADHTLAPGDHEIQYRSHVP